jgi:hypothetical protein
MIHMLKWVYSTGSRDPEHAWKRNIRNARKAIRRLIDNSPSLSTHLELLSERAYVYATEDAHDELSNHGDDDELFPTSCPWTFDELLHHEFWRYRHPRMRSPPVAGGLRWRQTGLCAY